MFIDVLVFRCAITDKGGEYLETLKWPMNVSVPRVGDKLGVHRVGVRGRAGVSLGTVRFVSFHHEVTKDEHVRITVQLRVEYGS